MPVASSTYFDLTRIREMSPETKDWATVDHNYETISLLLKAFEGHVHTGVAPINYPGYNTVDPNLPELPVLSEFTTGGVLAPGTVLGVRLGFVTALGLETAGSPETNITLSASAARPLTPEFVSKQVEANALPGGTYIYGITKKKGTGETLLSDVLPVEISYDNTYSVSIKFPAISTYTDGTDSINIYRSAGLSSAFQLVATVNNSTTGTGWTTTANETTFTDTNAIAPQNVNVQPPSSNTFDAARKVRIDFTDIDRPSGATKLRVYVTQQAALWSTNHLLSEIDLIANPGTNYVEYLGSESLGVGWPKNDTQIPASAPKVNLGTEATGAPILTADMDFKGFTAKNMAIDFIPDVPLSDGMIWYDPSTAKFRGFASGSAVDLTGGAVYVNAVKNPSAENDANFWIGLGGGGDSRPAPVRITTDGVLGSSCLEGTITFVAGDLGVYNFESRSANTLTAAGVDGIYAESGAIMYIRGFVKVPQALPAGSSLTIQVAYREVDGGGGGASAGTANVVSNPVSGTWYEVFGTVTLPASGPYYCMIRPRMQITGASTGTYSFRADKLMLTEVRSTSEVVAYFDGTYPRSYWKGTAHASHSVQGAFAHSIDEVGGHRADKILHNGLGSVNIQTILDRIVDFNGNQKQVIIPRRATAVTNDPTMSSSTPAVLTDMEIAAFGPDFDYQWLKIFFSGEFQIATALASASIGIEYGGSLIQSTIRSATGATTNASISLSTFYAVQMDTTANLKAIKVLWWVSSGQVRAVEQRRSLLAELVY